MSVAHVLVQIIITGIVAIVPSASDPNLTRIVVPNATGANERHRHIPEHYAFLDIREENYKPVKGEREPSFRYPDPHDEFVDADGKKRPRQHVVFLLAGEVIELEKTPDNSDTLTINKIMPASIKNPQTEEEKTSIFYALDMAKVCQKCRVGKDRFDIMNVDRVAARMDLHGGYEHVGETKFGQVWKLARSPVEQPLTSEIVFDYRVSLDRDTHERERLKITARQPVDGDRISYITLQGEVIPVTIGNSPLSGIMFLKEGAPVPDGVHYDEHFALIYDAFEHKPWFHHPNPKLVSGVFEVLRASSLVQVFRRGGNPLTDDCIPTKMGKQDP